MCRVDILARRVETGENGDGASLFQNWGIGNADTLIRAHSTGLTKSR